MVSKPKQTLVQSAANSRSEPKSGRFDVVQKTIRDFRKTALYELKNEAHAVGANVVVGVDLDYVELSGAGSMSCLWLPSLM
jgi:uncharacterized protein YbjQ (UPF0145 family)